MVWITSQITSGTNIRRRWRFYDLLMEPGTSDYATQNNRGNNDEIHIVVYDTEGDFLVSLWMQMVTEQMQF